MLVSTRSATAVELRARPAAGSDLNHRDCALAAPLSRRGLVEVSQPLAPELRSFARGAPINLNRPADCAQLQLVADANPTAADEGLGQCDLELAGHLRHSPILASIKDTVKDQALTMTGIGLIIIRSAPQSGCRRRASRSAAGPG
jgi:hypothetical protein